MNDRTYQRPVLHHVTRRREGTVMPLILIAFVLGVMIGVALVEWLGR